MPDQFYIKRISIDKGGRLQFENILNNISNDHPDHDIFSVIPSVPVIEGHHETFWIILKLKSGESNV